MGSTCSRDLQVCAMFISLPDSVTSYMAAKVDQSLCAERIGRAQGRRHCLLVGRCWVPQFYAWAAWGSEKGHDVLRVGHTEGRASKQLCSEAKAPSAMPQCLFSRCHLSKNLETTTCRCTDFLTVHPFPGQNVGGENPKAGLGSS